MATFIERFGKALDVTGIQNGHLAWWMAGVDFPSDADYDNFLSLLGGPPPPTAAPGGFV